MPTDPVPQLHVLVSQTATAIDDGDWRPIYHPEGGPLAFDRENDALAFVDAAQKSQRNEPTETWPGPSEGIAIARDRDVRDVRPASHHRGRDSATLRAR